MSEQKLPQILTAQHIVKFLGIHWCGRFGPLPRGTRTGVKKSARRKTKITIDGAWYN